MGKLISLIAAIALIVNLNNAGAFKDVLTNIITDSTENMVDKLDDAENILINQLVDEVTNIDLEELANSSEPEIRKMAELYYTGQFDQLQDLYDQLRISSQLSDTPLPDVNIVEKLMEDSQELEDQSESVTEIDSY